METQVHRLKVYLAGPMRNIPQFNFPAFEEASLALEGKGYIVLSPHRLDEDIGFDPSKSLEENGFNLRSCVKRDLDALLQVEGLVLLPGWENSMGAKAEKSVAEWLGLEMWEYDNGDISRPILGVAPSEDSAFAKLSDIARIARELCDNIKGNYCEDVWGENEIRLRLEERLRGMRF